MLYPPANLPTALHAEYYIYDGSGNRVRKITVANNERIEKIYLGGVEIKRIYSLDGSLKKLERYDCHVMDDTSRIAIVNHWVQDDFLREIDSSTDLNKNKIRYQYGNHLGSASLELNNTGALISYEEYFPYGGTSFTCGTNQKEVKLKEYRYTGKERDEATGLYYYGARYYAAWIGRWLSADPAGPVDGWNLYEYVRGNPVGLVDPDGMESKTDKPYYFVNENSEIEVREPGPLIFDEAHIRGDRQSADIQKLDGTPRRSWEEQFELLDWLTDKEKQRLGGSAKTMGAELDEGEVDWEPFVFENGKEGLVTFQKKDGEFIVELWEPNVIDNTEMDKFEKLYGTEKREKIRESYYSSIREFVTDHGMTISEAKETLNTVNEAVIDICKLGLGAFNTLTGLSMGVSSFQKGERGNLSKTVKKGQAKKAVAEFIVTRDQILKELKRKTPNKHMEVGEKIDTVQNKLNSTRQRREKMIERRLSN